MDIFNIQELTTEFTVIDVLLVLSLSFALTAFIGWIYQLTHRGTSYMQGSCQELVQPYDSRDEIRRDRFVVD